ncbi:MAG TPA: hydrolase 1, exosortase A system-associated [Telluria sp.]
MQFDERAQVFACGEDWLYGVVSVPAQPAPRGVLILVGGPQYRAGSHRQFVLLARHLAAAGVPVLRFDYRGMGDSEGAARTFEDTGGDLQAAVEHFFSAVPGLREVVVWGLCDAASSALCHAANEPRITGLVLVNPWARTETSIAKTTLKHYYRARLLEADLWKKILRGQFDLAGAARSFLSLVGAANRRAPAAAANPASPAALPDRMCTGLARFRGKVLLIIGSADLTGQEFCGIAESAPWRTLLAAPRVRRHTLTGADHTFSRRVWRDQVASWTCDWLRAW